ncbi:MAG TPA: FAD/NAD(P)-binding oxidoreductase [Gemmatimonadales bacterium]|nr:FAD/NAD(P)-binding oxidoreductase [Gemmatimonadales bacterium]
MNRSHVDVLVVGAGPAGLAAATAAADRGRRVLVLDQAPEVGGQIWRHRDPATLPESARAAIIRARASGVVFATGATVLDAASPTELVIAFGPRTDRVRADTVILATGAVERFLPFPGWTLPGVVGVGGLQALVKGGLSVRGQRIVVAGTGPLLYPVAATLAKAGATLLAVLEQRTLGDLVPFARSTLGDLAKVRDAIRYRAAIGRTPFHHDAWVLAAHGSQRVREVVLRLGSRETTIACDWVATAAGLVPRTDLARLLGCALDGEAVQVDAAQRTTVPGVLAVGECTGVKGEAAGMLEGEIAGAAAAGDDGPARTLARRRAQGIAFGDLLAETFAPRAELLARATPDVLLCRCEDVPVGAVEPAWTARQAKLWTRVGMGACQGAVCGPACTTMFGWEVPQVRAPLGTPTCGAWHAQLTTPTDPPAA